MVFMNGFPHATIKDLKASQIANQFKVSSAFFVVKPSKIRFLIQHTIPQKEDIILLYNGYHSIPK